MLQLLTSALVNLFVFGIALGTFYWLFFPSNRPGPDLPKSLAQDEVHKPSVSDIRPTGEPNHSTANVRATGKSLATYRLQGIPAGIDMSEIPKLLREAWDIPESIKVEVHSLAANPRRPEKKIATVSFSRTPVFLQSSTETFWVSTVNNKLVLDTHFRGFTPLHSDSDSICFMDCIAVSGLGGHAFGSFKSKNNSFMWLRDALPEDLPQSRIFIYGYDAESVDSKSFENIIDLGIKFQHSIKEIRPSRHGSVRPLVLIGHSLGGLVVKQAIINMNESQAEDDKTNLQSLRAALFFAVPTLGMNIESLIPMVEGKPNEDLVKSLKGTSETLRRQKEPFDLASRSILKYWYYETKESPTARLLGSKWSMTGPDALLVNPHSATNGRARSSEHDNHFVEPINRTHSEVVKFPHREDPYYATVSGHLKRIKDELPKNKSGRIRYILTDSQSECMRSLAIENQESRKRSIDLVPGTCKWIESHPIFRKWKGSRTGTLWIRGQPGSGKSSLMKYLTHALDYEKPNIASPVVASFFFHGTGLEVQRSLFGFYSALLNQLLSEIPLFCHGILERYSQGISALGKKFRWEMKELKDFLSSIISESTSTGIPIIILADALDEAGQNNAMELMQFFRSIENIAKKAPNGIYCSLRICFSCRPYPIIVGPDHEIIIDVDQHNGDDLSVFIRNKLKPDPSVWIEDGVLEKVQDEISSKAGRTFQWADLMIKEVRRMLTEMDPISNIQEQISTTPLDLHQFYRQLISPTILDGNANTKQNLRRQALTLKLFQWLCFSKGPLALATVQHALVLGPKEPDIAHPSEHRDFQPLKAMAVTVTKLSRGLVEIRTQDLGWRGMEEIVQFTHHSVYDFLLETGLADLSGSETADMAALGHFEISRACIQAMLMEDTTVFIDKHRPLIHYRSEAVQYRSPNPRDDHRIGNVKLPDCCYSFGLFATLLKKGHPSRQELIGDMISTWTSIYLDECLIPHSEQMIPVASYGSNNLGYHLEAVENCGWNQLDLLDLCNATNLWSTWQDITRLKRYGATLGGLVKQGVNSVLMLFLKQDPRSFSIKDVQGRTPLHHVITSGKDDDVIKLLIKEALERGDIGINQPDKLGRTPLHCAIKCGKKETVEILIREGLKHGTVNIDQPNLHGRTPLCHAIGYGRVDIDYTDHRGRSPIFLAAQYNRADAMRHLLRTDMVNVKRKDKRGDTALMIALECNHTEIASLLLEYGAPVETKNNSGRTPLLQAIRGSTMEMIRYLVEKAPDEVNVFDNQGRGILSHAAQRGNVLVTEYIFDLVPAQLKIVDTGGGLPIEYACGTEAFDFLKTRMGRREEALIKLTRHGQILAVECMLKEEQIFGSEILEQATHAVQGLEEWMRERIWSTIQKRKEKEGKIVGRMEEIKQLMKEQKRNRS